jgi:hypothetical protein
LKNEEIYFLLDFSPDDFYDEPKFICSIRH